MLVSPSLLSADFYRLDKEIQMINRSDAAWLHLDVMDGVFVPNISFGFPVIKSLQGHCAKPFDAHFMIVHPERYVEKIAQHGVMMMTVHIETVDSAKGIIDLIHANGMKAGLSLKPDTPVEVFKDVLTDADMFLVMSVYPGFSGQHFIDGSIERIRTLKGMLTAAGSKALIEVDGGVDGNNAPLLRAAGVDVVVCGDYVFKAADPIAVIKNLSLIK
ncbi:MAG: ribulose-phosphate 3-epimerase [Prevotella sp.]|nr:ribulose-phosphate 3-epimerase [Prevotella sp.]